MPTTVAIAAPIAVEAEQRIPWFRIIMLAFYAAAAVGIFMGMLTTDPTVASVAFP